MVGNERAIIVTMQMPAGELSVGKFSGEGRCLDGGIHIEMKGNETKKELNKKLLSLAVPIAFQQFLLAAVGAGDSAMLGFVSGDAMAAFWWKLPALVVYFILSLDEAVKIPWVYVHYKKYKWLNNMTMPSDTTGRQP